jgi:hypothetical protein
MQHRELLDQHPLRIADVELIMVLSRVEFFSQMKRREANELSAPLNAGTSALNRLICWKREVIFGEP